MSTEVAMIDLSDLTREFANGVRALDRVSFHVSKGEVVGLLGENGAGKSTAFRIISTMLRPTEGSCSVGGCDVVRDSRKVRSIIGVLSGSDPGLYGRLSARENIAYFASLHQISSRTINSLIDRYVSTLGMESYIDRRASTFSKGMLQKTAIARALIHNPKVLLLDEPCTGLDVGSSLVVYNMIKDLRKKGKTVMLATHSIREITTLCDRVLILKKGVLVEQGTIRKIEKKYGSDFESVFLDIMGYKK
jgi:sodium transport system ATP-binding protein